MTIFSQLLVFKALALPILSGSSQKETFITFKALQSVFANLHLLLLFVTFYLPRIIATHPPCTALCSGRPRFPCFISRSCTNTTNQYLLGYQEVTPRHTQVCGASIKWHTSTYYLTLNPYFWNPFSVTCTDTIYTVHGGQGWKMLASKELKNCPWATCPPPLDLQIKPELKWFHVSVLPP